MVESNVLLALQVTTIALLLFIALKDVMQRRVPNWTLLVLSTVVVIATPFSLYQAAISLMILLLGIAAFHFRWLGAGDSKLLAVCAYGSAEQWPWFILQTAIVGGGLSVVILLYNHLANLGLIKQNPTATVPYAVAISGSALTAIHYI
ncbi:prepilin peptidase [Vibrio sinaloensis]|uniref:A24 family peptidase n=1 Tax=Photobacterium sp. (strain ATCC 43367) TaxID=379097 RepID=UPI001CBB4CB7|nr:prepilin peptidase [Vibrio sinaloensis]